MIQEDLPLEFRVSRLTVQSLRNLCDAQNVPGATNLLKGPLVRFVIKNIERKTLEDFCRQQEDIYFAEYMAKAIKWAQSRKIVSLDPRSDHTLVNAVFTMRRSDGWEVYNVRFVNHTTDDVATSCECVDAREKRYFCPHQMSVLVRCLSEGLFDLDHWTGPMTPEAEELILANVLRCRKPGKRTRH